MSSLPLECLHLDPRIRSVAAEEAGTRIRMVEKDLFIEHDYSRHLHSLLEELLSGVRQTRMPCLLITGDAGMGKTAQLHRFQRQFPDHHHPETDRLIRPIVIVNVPPEPTRRTLEFAILDALHAPGVTHNRSVDHAGVIRRMLTAHETRILVFDEIQHICHARSRDRSVVLDSVKAFSTTCQINVICAGTQSVEREFMADAQLERRFEVTRFVPWTVGTAFKRFLETYERARPLRLPSLLAEPAMMHAILEEATAVTHRIVQRLNAAAMVAIHERIERITVELLSVQRTEPGRVLAAKRAALAATDGPADRLRVGAGMRSQSTPVVTP